MMHQPKEALKLKQYIKVSLPGAVLAPHFAGAGVSEEGPVTGKILSIAKNVQFLDIKPTYNH